MTRVPIRARAGLLLAAAVAAPALLLAACGGSSSSGTSNAYGASGTSKSPSSAAAKAAVVETHGGALGTYLTDGSGRTVYLFAKDTGTSSSCSGACATSWPPLLTKGAASAMAGAKGGMLGTTTRSDGTTQVTYAGHPLYYYAGDSAAGDTNGEGINQFGANWWAVAPSGAGITHAGSGSTPSTSSGGTRGGGWA